MKKIILVLGTIVFLGCGTVKNVNVLTYSPPLASNVPVEFMAQGQNVPSDAKLLGSINIGDSGFTINCNYQQVISDLQNQARRMGGNLLYITEHKIPDSSSTCHRISANVYKVKSNFSYHFRIFMAQYVSFL